MRKITQDQIELFNIAFYIERLVTQKQKFELKFKPTIIKNTNNSFDIIHTQNEMEPEVDEPVYNIYDKRTNACVLKEVQEKEIYDFINKEFDDYLDWREHLIKFNEDFIVEIEQIEKYQRTLKQLDYDLINNYYDLSEMEDAYVKKEPSSHQTCDDELIGYIRNKQTHEIVFKFTDVWALSSFILQKNKPK